MKHNDTKHVMETEGQNTSKEKLQKALPLPMQKRSKWKKKIQELTKQQQKLLNNDETNSSNKSRTSKSDISTYQFNNKTEENKSHSPIPNGKKFERSKKAQSSNINKLTLNVEQIDKNDNVLNTYESNFAATKDKQFQWDQQPQSSKQSTGRY